MSLEAILRGAKRAIVLGVGGGGDVVGTVPTARLLEQFGITSVLGGLSWERWVIDPHPGSRTLDEVVNVRPLAPTVWLANADSATTSGVRFAESGVATFYGSETLLVDISQGVPGVVAGLRAACAALDADLLVGIDVGGDSLATGGEPGLRSPVADAITLAAFAALATERRCLWGMIGYGSDAELTPREIDAALATVAAHGGLLGAWGVTPAVAAELQGLLAHVQTEASAVVVEAAAGAVGERWIRAGTRRLDLSPVCTVTFYLDPLVLYTHVAAVARAVAAAPSLAAASDVVLALGLHSEYAAELELQRAAAPPGA